MITPFPVKTAVVSPADSLMTYIWAQWFTGLRSALNLTPGNSMPTTVAALPEPVTGMVLVVTDSTVDTWGAVVTGGGTLTVAAFWNGTNWTVAAK